MTVRDRVVLWVLVGGAVAGIIAWQALGKWPALVIVILAVVAASVAYRVERPVLPPGRQPTVGPARLPAERQQDQ